MSAQHEVPSITIRYVRDEARQRHDWSDHYLPWCRGNKHEGIGWPDWNVLFRYKTHSVRGGGMSFWWCDKCLPNKYRKVIDSMKRGDETTRIIQGEAMEEIAPPRVRRKPSGADFIPYGELL